MRSLAGELRWIKSRDEAVERRVMAQARKLEDLYFSRIEEDRVRKVRMVEQEMVEVRKHVDIVDQFKEEEGLWDCPAEEEDLLNRMMDQLMGKSVDEMVEDENHGQKVNLRLLKKRRRNGRQKFQASFMNYMVHQP